MLFIDGSNLWHAVHRINKTYPKFRVDYVKLIEYLVSGRNYIRAYFYASHAVPPKQEEASFHNALKAQHIEVKLKPIKRRGDKLIEKGVDVSLVTDMLSLGFKKAYDTAIIISGDADFCEAINEIKGEGRKVEIAAFRDSINKDTQYTPDRFVLLDDIMDQIKVVEFR